MFRGIQGRRKDNALEGARKVGLRMGCAVKKLEKGNKLDRKTNVSMSGGVWVGVQKSGLFLTSSSSSSLKLTSDKG